MGASWYHLGRHRVFVKLAAVRTPVAGRSTRGSSTTRSTRDRLPVIKQMLAAYTAQATSRAPSVM